LKLAIALAILAASALVANAQDAKTAPAASPNKSGCATPPAVLVKSDLATGTGRDIKPRTAILVGYTGWLYDGCAKDLKGEKFDSSVGRPTAFGFMVGAGRVIKGWDEGVVGMKEKGSKRLLIIPPDKAYGAAGAGNGKIPPNATLVFEVEVFQFVHYPDDTQPPAKPAPKS
jgi:FKBP-type peptidyl-prolyl cis-trans isomerase